MPLDVQIKVDGANPAVAAADKVTAALDRVEDKGPAVGAAIDRGMAAAQRAVSNLAQTFRGLGSVMEARARATQVHAQMNNHLANSFAGVAAQIAREKQMLDSIHGPMQRYEQSVRTLDMLHAKGAISANQHAAALARARSAAGMGNPTSAVSLPGTKDKKAEKSGGMGLGGVAAGLGITLGAREALELGDSYIGLENRMRQVAKSQSELNHLMSQVSGIASRTRSDLSATGESFVRLVQATKHLGVSQERALKITETLSMALQSSGASSSEAAAGTLQLMQAMAAGALQGDEFRSVAENMPMLLDVLSKQLGVSRGELKKMGAEGKITTDIMIKALEAFGPEAKKTFEQSEETFGQFVTGIKNSAAEFLGGGVSMAKAFRNWGAATQALRLEEIELGNAMARVHPWFGTLVSDATGMTAATYALTKSQLEHMKQTDQLVRSLNQLADMMKIINGLRNATSRKELFEGMESSVDAAIGAGEANAAAKERAKIAAREAKERERADRAVERTRFPGGPHDLAGKADDRIAKELDKAAKEFEKQEKDRLDREQRMQQDLHDRRVEQLEKEQQKIEEMQQRMADGFADIMDDLAKSAFDGSQSVNDMMRRVWMNMFRLMSQQALGSAFGGGSLPGFAHGGSFQVAGHGSTDTTPVAFMATPGERVTVETPGQQQGSGGGDGPVHIAIHLDERDAVRQLDTENGRRFIARVVKRVSRLQPNT